MAQRAGAPMLGTLLFSLVTFAQSPNLSITKMADATPVPTGTTIGYTITVSNSNAAGTGTAFNVQLSDIPPMGPGLNWSISPAYAGPGTCAINSLAPPTLNCGFGNLAPGATATVHIQSPTTAPPGSSAGSYSNVALVSGTGTGPIPSKQRQHCGEPSATT